jgi:L-Ala-D/L-Glu epimerase
MHATDNLIKLDKISVYRLKVPLLVPYRLAFGPVEYFDTIIASATDRDGNTGFGEATILTGYTDETIDGSWQEARQFAGELAAMQDKPDAAIARLGVKFPFTATAFGTALEMLHSSPLLNLDQATSVPLVGLLNAKEGDAIAIEFEKLLDEGYRTIKVKVGFEATQDSKMVRAIQQVVKGRARSRIDANQGYTAEQGVAFAKALAQDDIELFEQPCAAGDWDAHMAVVKVAQVPMMLDESIYGMADIEKAAKLKAAAYIKVKLMKLVTLEALAEAIALIKNLGMKAVLGNGVACDPGCWMEACIAARSIDNAGEMNGFLKAKSPLLSPGLKFYQGAMQIAPGFSPRLDMAGINAHLVDSLSIAPGASRKS